MDRKRVIVIAIALISALLFFQLYRNTIIHWDGYGVEVESVTGIDPAMLITIEPTGLVDYPAVATFLDEAGEGGTVMVTDVMGLEQFYSFLRSRGHDLDTGFYFLELEGETYSVSMAAFGGMDDQPLYMYLAGFMVVVAAALTVEGLRKKQGTTLA